MAKDQPTKIVLVRGLLGAYMPGHFQRVRQHLQRLGFDCEIAPTLPHGAMFQNARRLQVYFENASSSNRLLILAHSKGGIEALLALDALAGKNQRTPNVCAAVLLQTPRRGAPYLRSVFTKADPRPVRKHLALKEASHRLALTMVGAQAACLELATIGLLPGVEAIDRAQFGFPVWTYSSYSNATENSKWVELQSRRIEELEPGRRNDGVFLTEDQVWDKFQHRELTFELDHAEPTVGSARIYEPKVWEDILLENALLTEQKQ